MKKYNVTIVFEDGLSSSWTNVLCNDKSEVFERILKQYRKSEVDTMTTITIVEKPKMDF